MTHNRPLRLAAVAAALAMLVAACGRDDAKDSSTTTAADGTSDTTASSKAFIDPAKDCTSYDGTKGITGDTIKIGTVRPESGPYSIYDTVTKGLAAYVGAVNAKGGVKAGDGKTYKLELVKADDGYDPARTPGEVQRLVEQEGIFAMVGEIGTSNNLAVRQYMNDKCVPSIGLATGSTEWGNAAQYPWYIGGLPSYATEGHAFMEWLKANKPEAKIALLYQDDDYGKAYQAVIKKDIKGTKITVVDEQSFNPLTETSPESKVAQLSGSGADVFFVGIGGTPCPAAIRAVPGTWTPLTYVSITCSGKTAMALTQGHDEGLYSAQATLDVGTTADQANPKVQEFFTEGAAQGLDQGTLEGGIAAAGWGFGSMFVRGLELTPKVDRATLMNTLYSMKDQNYGLMLDDAKVNTDGAKDPWVLEDLRIIVRKSGQWTEASKLVSYDGKSNDIAK
ncbi:MAG: ABC transporter substrate-binding protein [Acidimicrobiales bacterium]